MNTIKLIAITIFLNLYLITVFFTEEIFPFTRVDMFSSSWTTACAPIVYDQNNDIIPLGYEVEVQRLAYFLNQKKQLPKKSVCDFLRTQINNLPNQFLIYSHCAQYSSEEQSLIYEKQQDLICI